MFSQAINELEAQKIAENFFEKFTSSPIKLTSSDTSEHKRLTIPVTSVNNDTLYYVINNSNDKGFVIISADERVWPILGYS